MQFLSARSVLQRLSPFQVSASHDAYTCPCLRVTAPGPPATRRERTPHLRAKRKHSRSRTAHLPNTPPDSRHAKAPGLRLRIFASLQTTRPRWRPIRLHVPSSTYQWRDRTRERRRIATIPLFSSLHFRRESLLLHSCSAGNPVYLGLRRGRVGELAQE